VCRRECAHTYVEVMECDTLVTVGSIYIYIHVHIHAYMRTYIQIKNVYTCTCMCMQIMYGGVQVYTCMCMQIMYGGVQVYMHVHMSAYQNPKTYTKQKAACIRTHPKSERYRDTCVYIHSYIREQSNDTYTL
jgi:hypothetical protein